MKKNTTFGQKLSRFSRRAHTIIKLIVAVTIACITLAAYLLLKPSKEQVTEAPDATSMQLERIQGHDYFTEYDSGVVIFVGYLETDKRLPFGLKVGNFRNPHTEIEPYEVLLAERGLEPGGSAVRKYAKFGLEIIRFAEKVRPLKVAIDLQPSRRSVDFPQESSEVFIEAIGVLHETIGITLLGLVSQFKEKDDTSVFFAEHGGRNLFQRKGEATGYYADSTGEVFGLYSHDNWDPIEEILVDLDWKDSVRLVEVTGWKIDTVGGSSYPVKLRITCGGAVSRACVTYLDSSHAGGLSDEEIRTEVMDLAHTILEPN